MAGGYLFQTFLGTSYPLGVILLATIVLIYTASGGLFAVAYTDAIQVSIALVGSLCLLGFIGLNFGLDIPAGTGPMALEQMTRPGAGAIVNWATLLALGFGDIVAIDFMARIFAADSPETAQKACFIGSLGTVIIGVPFSVIALSAPKILEQAGIMPDGPILYVMLQNVVPSSLALLVIVAILSASLSTADGAILGTSSVIAHNILGIRQDRQNSGDQLLVLTRAMAVLITAMGVFLALKIPQTGVLLLLAFDLGLAGLLVPLVGGLFYPKSTQAGALACIVSGSLIRLGLFVLMPVTFGIENTLFYIPNSVLTANFDGMPTFISPLIGLLLFFVISRLTYKPACISE